MLLLGVSAFILVSGKDVQEVVVVRKVQNGIFWFL